MKLAHINFKGTRTIGGYSASSWDTRQGHTLELLESGVIRISKPGEPAIYVGPNSWDGAEALEADATGPVKPQASLEASKASVPEATYLDEAGEAVKQSYNPTKGGARKTRKN